MSKKKQPQKKRTTKKRVGRPPKYKTEAERKDARRKYAKDYHKKVRQPKIEQDQEHRELINSQRRARYRRNNPTFQAKTFGANAGSARLFAEKGCLSVEAMAEFLGVSVKVMRAWILTGKFPNGNTATSSGEPTFTISYADQLAHVLNKGLQDRATFRPSDTQVIESLKKVKR